MGHRTILARGDPPRQIDLTGEWVWFEWGEGGDTFLGETTVTPSVRFTIPGVTFLAGQAENSGMYRWSSPAWRMLLVRRGLAFALAALLPAVQLAGWVSRKVQSAVHRFRAATAARRALAGQCVACGYSLTGNVSGTCPECGVQVGSASVDGIPGCAGERG
jgi:hypothetical protein